MTNSAVIWDMDGVIVDTGRFHFQSWQEVLAKRGVPFTEKQFQRCFGQRNDTIIRTAIGETVSQQEIDAIADEKEKGFRRRISPGLKTLPGVVELMSSLKEHGFKMAVASSGPRENIQLLIKTVGISDYLDTVVAGRDVTEGKPSPQIFLLAAQKLGVEPAKCVVIEDSIAGVMAAKRAGMSCLAVTNTNTREKLGEADLIVDSLATVNVSQLERLHNSKQECNMEKSLVLIKPDAVQRGLSGAIIAHLEKRGLKLVALRMLHMDKELAQRHYAVHRGKPFFDGLVKYITSGPIVAMVLAGTNAVDEIRKTMGATDPAKSEKGTIRGDFGLDIERNSVHGSDSPKTAAEEIKLFFTEKEILDY